MTASPTAARLIAFRCWKIGIRSPPVAVFLTVISSTLALSAFSVFPYREVT
jgi:hypothetical protein